MHERLQAPAEELLLVRVDLEDKEPAEEDVLEAPGRTSRGSLCRPGQRYKKARPKNSCSPPSKTLAKQIQPLQKSYKLAKLHMLTNNELRLITTDREECRRLANSNAHEN